MDSTGGQSQVTGIAPAAPVHPYRGLLLFMFGVFLFACMDCTTKYLVQHYQVPLVVAIRYIVNCLLMIMLLAPSRGRALVTTQRTGLVLVRGACLAAASLFVASALQRMPIAEATSIVFLSPLLVLLLAGLVLGERVGALGWIAALMGFGGVLLIAHPGSGLDPVGTACALGAVLSTAAYQLLSRTLASTEKTVPMLFYTTIVGSLVFGMYLPWSWGGEMPTAFQLLLFLGVGAMGGLGHFFYTAAHRDAPASLLAPMMYSQLVWAGLLGWLVFGHVPGTASIIGMCIVASAGAVVAVKSRLNRNVLVDDPIE